MVRKSVTEQCRYLIADGVFAVRDETVALGRCSTSVGQSGTARGEGAAADHGCIAGTARLSNDTAVSTEHVADGRAIRADVRSYDIFADRTLPAGQAAAATGECTTSATGVADCPARVRAARVDTTRVCSTGCRSARAAARSAARAAVARSSSAGARATGAAGSSTAATTRAGTAGIAGAARAIAARAAYGTPGATAFRRRDRGCRLVAATSRDDHRADTYSKESIRHSKIPP